MRNKANLLIPSFGHIIFITLFLILILSGSLGMNLLRDGDTGYHIKTGEFILDNFSIPRYDIFSSITPSPPWLAFEWFSDVIMALVHGAYGLTGIVIIFSFLISASYYVLYKSIRLQKGNLFIAVFVICMVITSSIFYWLARPHIFSLLLMVIWYYVLDAYYYYNRNYLYYLPLLMLLWVNLHGAFILGFILIGVYFFGSLIKFSISQSDERRRFKQKTNFLGIIAFACLLAALINPYGYHMLLHPLKIMNSKYIMDFISEFKSPNFHHFIISPFNFLLLFLIFALGISKKRLNFIEITLLVLFLNMALYSVRHVLLLGIIAAPILSRQIETLLNNSNAKLIDFLRRTSEEFNAVDINARGYLWIFVPILFVTVVAANGKIQYTFDKNVKAIAATEFLKSERLKENIFNEYEFGDYIIYGAYSQYKVFVDGRADMYVVDRTSEYNKVKDLKAGWEEILDKYNINIIIFNTDSILSKFLLERNEWKLIYADKVANIFLKNIPENQYVINRYGDIKPVTGEENSEISI